MAFCLRHQARLEEKLGRGVLLKLFKLVSQGMITKHHLERMSDKHKMNVTNFNDMREEECMVTMERMLDRWYEDTVCKLSTSEASQRLLRILEETCPARVVETVRETEERYAMTERYNVQSKPKGVMKENDSS